MKSYRKELWFETPARRAFLNITGHVEKCLHESGIKEGLILVSKTKTKHRHTNTEHRIPTHRHTEHRTPNTEHRIPDTEYLACSTLNASDFGRRQAMGISHFSLLELAFRHRKTQKYSSIDSFCKTFCPKPTAYSLL